MTIIQRLALTTGVELNVAIAGDPKNPPIIFLHGFPESHRTWRHIIPDLARDHFVLAPDQRGYARSSKPQGVAAYAANRIVADIFALADHFGVAHFTLVGHDWGGAVAWTAALKRPDRVNRLAIINAPHPFVLQRTIFDEPAQRQASQYIRAFRGDVESYIELIGLSAFFDRSFAGFTDVSIMDDKEVYLDEWRQPGALTGMFNWYRASAVIVPAMEETPKRPAFLDGPFPPTRMPVLAIWGMNDTALLPSQLEGLAAYVPELTVAKVEAGHFITWEKPDAVITALRNWLPGSCT